MDSRSPWRVLVVDDEEGVHSITRMIFRGYEFEQRPVELISALSGAEARDKLARYPDICLALLDVVMESDDEGLRLVDHIRDTLGNLDMRLILRTGHPGFAPETDVIVRYDINDYLSKAELSASRLLTSVLVALRSYRDIVGARRQPQPEAAQTPATTDPLVLPLLADNRRALQRLRQLELTPMARDLVAQLSCNGERLRALYLQVPGELPAAERQPCAPRQLIEELLEEWLPLSRQQQRLLDLRVDGPLPDLQLPTGATRTLWSALLAHALLGNGASDLLLALSYTADSSQLTLELSSHGDRVQPPDPAYRTFWEQQGRQRCDRLCRTLGGTLTLLADSDEQLLLRAGIAA
jgi:CheY-like chemotaxis protein